MADAAACPNCGRAFEAAVASARPTPARPTSGSSLRKAWPIIVIAAILFGAYQFSKTGASFPSAPPDAPPAAVGTPAFAWLPADYTVTSDPTVGYRWLKGVTCALDSCWGIEAIAHVGCPNSLYIELSILDDSGAAVGYTNDVVSALAPDQHAKMTFENVEHKGHQATIAKVTCY